MKIQKYSNHVRYYVTHHFIFYPVVLACAVTSAVYAFNHADRSFEWLAISGLFIIIAWLSYMLRQHYALNNQNRIVRLEIRFRYYVLTQQRLDVLENSLSFSQLAALRFASDEELPQLVQRAIQEQLSPDDIKKSIQQWVPDHMRV